MPNYSIAVNSTFQPFSYQELMAPIQRMSDYHEKLNEEYDNLSRQADVLQALGTDDKDSKSYNKYLSYSNALKAEADNLYRNGLNAESRYRLSELRRRYNQEIVPLQNAYIARKADVERQQEALLKNPNLRFTWNASEAPLESYIDNPERKYGVVDLNAVANDMARVASTLAKQIRNHDIENIDGVTKNFITRHGLDPAFISKWQRGEVESGTLDAMKNQVLAAHGLSGEDFLATPNGERIKAEAENAARNAVWSAVGEDKERNFESYSAKSAIDLNNYRRKKEMDIEDKWNQNDPISPFNRQAGSLPIAIADGKIDKTVNKNAGNLGLVKDPKNTNRFIPNTLRIGYTDTYNKVTYVSAFDENGRLKTQTEFKNDVMNSVKNIPESVRKQLMQNADNKYREVSNTISSLGMSPGKKYTVDDINNALKLQRESGAAGYINGYHMPHKNSDWNSIAQNLHVQEITKTDHDGNFSLDGSKGYKLADLLNTNEGAEINKSKQDVSAFVTMKEGQEGIIFTVGNRQFFVPEAAMTNTNSNLANAFKDLRDSETARKYAELYAFADDLPNAYTYGSIAKSRANSGLSLLESGLGLRISPSTQNWVDQPTSAQNGLISNQ